MTLAAAITLVLLVCAIVLLVTEWVPAGVTGLLLIAALAVTGVLPAAAAFGGLTNSAVLTVACMYVVSAGVDRTGAAALVANRIAAAGARPLTVYHALLGLTLLLSGFVNNTPLVLIFMPMILGLADRIGEPPSRLLMPLSFVSILGGMCTMIGTSTNLIVASSLADASKGALRLGMFDFAWAGVILAIAGTALVLALRRRLLPIRGSLGLRTQKGMAVEYLTEIDASGESPLIGRSLGDITAERLLADELRVLEVVRGDIIRAPRRELVIETGDLLLVKGPPEAVLELRQREQARTQGHDDTVRSVQLTLFEVVVTPDSPWVGRRIGDLDLHARFGASAFAVQRHGSHVREQFDQMRLHVGDVLLVQGPESAIGRLREAAAVLVVEGVDEIVRDTRRAPLVLLAMAVFVVPIVTGLLPVEVAALCAALLVVLTGCVPIDRAYAAIGWDVLLMIAGTLALGRAFEATGLARAIAEGVVGVVADLGPYAVVGAMLTLTAALTQILSNNATAAIMTPLAYNLGLAMPGMEPMPCVMAVAFGANCSFLTPVSYNTNLLVYGPGGYRFRDFLRPGLPLTVLFLGLATLLLPALY